MKKKPHGISEEYARNFDFVNVTVASKRAKSLSFLFLM
jgi:hypothetical protein